MHLLIIDDNPSLLRALERLLAARKDWVLHCATQNADVRLALHQFEIQGVLLDHDLSDERSHSIITLIRKDFPHLVSKTWLMHGALEDSQWTPEDHIGVAGTLVKPQGLSQLVPWLDRLNHSHETPSSGVYLKSPMHSDTEVTMEAGKPLEPPIPPLRELEWALKDLGAWNVEVATLLETLEEKVDLDQVQVIVDTWKRKRPPV